MTQNLVAIIISVFSLVITTVLAIIQIVTSNRNNAHYLQANLIKEMYEKTLMSSIPSGLEYIRYDGRKITGVEKLIFAVCEIRRVSLYFKATDRCYYDNVHDKCQKLEIFLSEATRDYTPTEFAEFMNRVDEEVNKLFMMISKKYAGK